MASSSEEDDDDDKVWRCTCWDGEVVKFDVSKIAEYSGYFSAMMRSEMKETMDRNICLDLISSDTLIILLKLFSVCDRPLSKADMCTIFDGDILFDNVEELLKTVDYLDMPCLYPRCCDILKTMLPSFCTNVNMVWRLWESCQNFGLETVADEICSYVAKNMSDIDTTDHYFFREIPLELLAGVLSFPDINVTSEVEIMKLIENWILYCPDERQKGLDTLVKSLHIPSIMHCDLHDIEQMLRNLNAQNFNISKTLSCYLSNPHKFFISRHGQSEIRNGREAVILFGGLHEHMLLPHNMPSSRQRRYNDVCLPLLYQTVEEVSKHCLSDYYSDNQIQVVDKKRKSKRKKKNVVSEPSTSSSTMGSGLCLKLMSRVRAPVKLVEFGVVMYENFVYLAGGQRMAHDEAKHSVRGIWRMDCHMAEWNEVCPMREPRCLFYMCEMWDRLYVIGGANQYGILQHVEYYVPQEDHWCDGPSLPTPLHEHTGCTLDNKIYVSGGHNDIDHSDQMLVLDSKEGEWHLLAPMLQPRAYHAMAAVGGHVYVFGGCCSVGEEIKDLYSVDEYDPQTDTWTAVVNLNVPICGSLPLVFNNEVLFIGSYSFEIKAYLQQTFAIDIKTHKLRIAPIEFSCGKRVVAYQCLKLKLKSRLIK